VPLLLQRQLIQAFDASGPNRLGGPRHVGTRGRLLTGDRNPGLPGALRFRPNGPPQIVIGIQAKLARMPQRQIATNINVTQQVQATANNLDSIVAAFNQAVGAALGPDRPLEL